MFVVFSFRLLSIDYIVSVQYVRFSVSAFMRLMWHYSSLEILRFLLTTVIQNCYLQMRFLGSQCHRNALAAGAPPRTPLGELTALPQTP